MAKRCTLPLNGNDFGDFCEYGMLIGKDKHAQTVRELFFKALRRRLAKLKNLLETSRNFSLADYPVDVAPPGIGSSSTGLYGHYEKPPKGGSYLVSINAPKSKPSTAPDCPP